MERSVDRVVCRIFYIVFTASFAVLTVLLMGSRAFGALLFVPAALLVFLLLRAVWRGLGRHAELLEKRCTAIIALFACAMLILEIAAGAAFRFKPAWDLEAIYGGAIEWVETGGFSSHAEYFQYFPNNLGGMTLLYAVFSVFARLGGSDYFMAAVVLNSLLCTGTMAVVSLTCRRLFGGTAAVFALVLFAVSPPFYFMGAVFYTDTLSMLFPALFYFLYLHFTASRSLRGRLEYAVLMGLTAAVGMEIKFTVLIIVIAVAADVVLSRRRWRDVGLLAAVVAVCIAAVFSLFQGYFYSRHLDRGQADAMNTPISHWVMMGLEGDGGYNPQDYEFTRSFDDPAERDRAIRAEIGSRIETLGAGGLLRLWVVKSVSCFGDGTFALSDFLDDTPQQRTALHEIVLADGRNHAPYRFLCGVVFTAILLLMLTSALARARDPSTASGVSIAPYLAVFGMLLFTLLWETSGRLILNFVPVIFLSAVPGAGCDLRRLTRREKEKP